MRRKFFLACVIAALLAIPAFADTATMHCGNYTATLTSDGPSGSLTLGNNGCGIVSWNDTTESLSFTSGTNYHSLEVSRAYTLTFVADTGFAFTQLNGYSSFARGNGYGSGATVKENSSLTDLSNSALAPFSPCVTNGAGFSSSVGCVQQWNGYFDESNGNECCMLMGFRSQNVVSGTGPIALPGNGFIVNVSTDVQIGGPPEAFMNYGIGGFSGYGNAFEVDIAGMDAAPVSAPEPATMALLGGGLMVLGGSLRRRS